MVHSLYPQHLIFRKRGLPLRPLFRKTVLPAEKTLLLPADGLLCSQYCKTSALCCSDRTPGSTETFAPIQTLSPTVIGRAISKCNFALSSYILQLILHEITIMNKSEIRIQFNAHVRCRDLYSSTSIIPCIIYNAG